MSQHLGGQSLAAAVLTRVPAAPQPASKHPGVLVPMFYAIRSVLTGQ